MDPRLVAQIELSQGQYILSAVPGESEKRYAHTLYRIDVVADLAKDSSTYSVRKFLADGRSSTAILPGSPDPQIEAAYQAAAAEDGDPQGIGYARRWEEVTEQEAEALGDFLASEAMWRRRVGETALGIDKNPE